VNGAGNLTTFPSLTGYVPYTGATNDLNLGTHNLFANNLFDGFTNVAATGTQIVLTIASTPSYTITGSGGQTIKLPDATTLPNGAIYSFNNNQSSGAISVNNNSNTLVVSIPSGGYAQVVLLDNSIAAGSWDRHFQAPANVSWSTNTLDYAGSITSATWNGVTIQPNRGGTGQSTYTDGQLLIGNSTGNTLSKSTLTAGTGISITNGSGSISIASTITQYTDALARASISLTTTGTSGAATYNSTTGVLNIPQYADAYVGTVTSVGLSAPTGFSVSGSPVTSSGTLALAFASGYSLPTTASQTNWDTAYTNRITSATAPLSITSNVISISQATTSTNGYLSSTDWNTFNNKQGTITLTTIGTSGAATFVGNTLNIPNYGSALSSYVPYTGATTNLNLGTYGLTTATITITGGAGTTGSLNFGQSDAFAIPANGYSSIDAVNTTFSFAVGTGTTTYKYFTFLTTSLTDNTLRNYTLPDASGTIALTSNIPSLTGYVNTSGSPTTNYLPKFTGSSTIGNSSLQDNGSTLTTSSNLSIKSSGNYGLIINSSYTPSGKYWSLGVNYNNNDGELVFIPTSTSFGDAKIIFQQNGNVGIGTTTDAGYKLDVNGTGRFSGVVTATQINLGGGAAQNQLQNAANNDFILSNSGNFRIINNSNTVALLTITNAGAATFSANVAAASFSAVGQISTSNGADADLLINVTAAGAGTKYASIQSSVSGRNLVLNPTNGGNVGIGTTTPQDKFEVLGAGFFRDANAGVRVGGAATYGFISAYTYNFGASASLALQTGGGNVLIGTTTDAGYKLDVNGTGRFSGKLTISNTSDVYAEMTTSSVDGDNFFGFSNTGDGNSSWGIGRRNTGEFWIANYTGNFLSGTRTTPLVIASTGAATFSSSVRAGGDISVSNAIRYKVSGTEYGVSFANAGAFGIEAYQGTYFYIGTGSGASATERMRITSGGNVGIGVTNPTSKLYVAGAGVFEGTLTTAPTGFGSGAFKIGIVQSGSASSAAGYLPIVVDGTQYYINLYNATP
jgi:hypothetical protein